MKKLHRPDEAAEMLSVSRSSIYRLVADGALEACKVRGSLRITTSSIEAFIERQVEQFQRDNGILCVSS